MAIVGVGSSARVLSESIAREGQRILGGDVALSLIHREADESQQAWLRSQGQVSTIATMRAVSRLEDGKSALVELKAVESAYPPLGQVVLDPAGDLAALLGAKDGTFGFVAEDGLVGAPRPEDRRSRLPRLARARISRKTRFRAGQARGRLLAGAARHHFAGRSRADGLDPTRLAREMDVQSSAARGPRVRLRPTNASSNLAQTRKSSSRTPAGKCGHAQTCRRSSRAISTG